MGARMTAAGLAVAVTVVAAPVMAQQTPQACRVELEFPAGCASTGPAGTPYVPGANCRWVSVDGFPRQYIVYVPNTAAPPLPVVFMHHGSSGNGLKFFNISGWREKAQEVGLVAVFPTALEVYFLEESRCTTKWNAYNLEDQIHPDIKPVIVPQNGMPPQEYPDDAPWPADDIAFVRAMLGDVQGGLPIDASRVYLSGFSNGAGFGFRASIELSDVLAAVGISGGGLRGPNEGLPPVPLRYIPVALQLGECDPKIAEGLGIEIDLDSCLAGQSDGLPIRPAAILKNPILADRIHFHLDGFGLAHEPDGKVADAESGCLAWSTPARPDVTASRYEFAVLGSVTHEYPRCNATACNNPHGFSAADRFWAFFSGTGGCQ
jgi:poly(3-hydroxybutyrate) depolymerase